MKRVLLILVGFLSGCGATSVESGSHAAEQAKSAIAKQDYRLYRVPVRGMILPGIAVPERANAAEVCGTRVLKGVGDTLTSDADLQAHKQRTDYAAEYNQLVYAACIALPSR